MKEDEKSFFVGIVKNEGNRFYYIKEVMLYFAILRIDEKCETDYNIVEVIK